MNLQETPARDDKAAGQSLAQLHMRLNHSDNPEAIRAQIRAALPSVDTARALPQKKTPDGKTDVLHMNYMRSRTDAAVEFEHLLFFAKTAQTLGLRLEILTDKSCQTELEQVLEKDEYSSLDYAITVGQRPVAKWAEDSVEYLANGQAVLTSFDDELLRWAMTAGRRQRWQQKLTPDDLTEVLRDDHLWILLGTGVNTLGMSLERERVARSKGQPVGHIRAYIEGGNMITGENAAGSPVILVGKDAIAATANLYQITNDEVKTVIAEDFGLDAPEQVIGVEQPGKFHLDMGMLFIGKGTVVVNDSSIALKNALEMAELAPCITTEKMAAKLQLQSALENDAAKDLATNGLEVLREQLAEATFYNFFNGEFVRGKDGADYYITNGGLKMQEERFEALMCDRWNVVKKVFFSPQAIAQKSLQERGGVGCRLKGSRRLAGA